MHNDLSRLHVPADVYLRSMNKYLDQLVAFCRPLISKCNDDGFDARDFAVLGALILSAIPSDDANFALTLLPSFARMKASNMEALGMADHDAPAFFFPDVPPQTIKPSFEGILLAEYDVPTIPS